MRILNLYYYFFFMVYLRLYLPKHENLRYKLALAITVLMLVMVIQCIIGNIALIAGPKLVSKKAIIISIPLAAALAYLATYITLLQKHRGYRRMEIFPPWQGMQYLHNMFTGLPKLQPLDNERYNGIGWTTVQEVLEKNKEQITISTKSPSSFLSSAYKSPQPLPSCPQSNFQNLF